ncbi:MAG: protease modulator HflC [Oribacterium sp.]|uniref:protease modulator HflC n=1 Tax=Oribacterium sp. oral taxon 102 TaxID=671214 RepID=UPI001FAB4DE5|nr:protease modulator HflC [Oribacterium sp. oral taxon 102]
MNTEMNTGRPADGKRLFSRGLLLVLLFLLLLLLRSSFFTVRMNYYGVVTQFGKIVRVEPNAGLKLKLPLIQSVSYVPKTLQVYDIAPSDVITRDKKSMISDNYILWQIIDPVRFMQTLNGSISGAQDRCSVASYNATKNVISSMSQDDIIAARGEKLTDLITEDANSSIGEYGIRIAKTAIKALDLPDDNKEAVYQRMISERNNIAAAHKAEGDSAAQKIRNETDREVAVMNANADKEAAILEAEGEQIYMQTLQNAYNTPEKADFYNYLRSLDALKASLRGENKTVILDKDSELAKVLYGVN